MSVDHYEALFDSTYLRWMDIIDHGDVLVTITKIEPNVELTLRGGAKKKAPLLHFKGAKKPLVMNRTNGDSIAKIHGKKPSNWIGKQIVLYVTTTNCKGETVNCIRIKGPIK